MNRYALTAAAIECYCFSRACLNKLINTYLNHLFVQQCQSCDFVILCVKPFAVCSMGTCGRCRYPTMITTNSCVDIILDAVVRCHVLSTHHLFCRNSSLAMTHMSSSLFLFVVSCLIQWWKFAISIICKFTMFQCDQQIWNTYFFFLLHNKRYNNKRICKMIFVVFETEKVDLSAEKARKVQ